MRFIIRQIARRAGGGDIVRERTLDSDAIVLGRGSDCDIQLTDLTLALQHARLVLARPGVVVLDALAGQPFEVGRRFVDHAELRLEEKPALTFGDFEVELSAGASATDVVVTVNRTEAAATRGAVVDERRAFSLAGAAPGKRAMAWAFGLLILAICLGLPVAAFLTHTGARIHSDRQWSSGPLSKAHAFLGHDCQACHQQAFVAVRDQACLACHQAGLTKASVDAILARVRASGSPKPPPFVLAHAAHDRLSAATPLPEDLPRKVGAMVSRLFHHPGDRCASCHLEHVPAPAGGASATPALEVRHGCVDCHAALKRRLKTTRLLDVVDWSRHPDFRPIVTLSPEGAKPQTARLDLERRPSERNGLIFPHALHVSASGGVARMAQTLGMADHQTGSLSCASCHRSDLTGPGFHPVEMVRDCAACHSLAYARVGGKVLMLPHGHPDQVAAGLMGSRSVAATASGGPRRRPGDINVASGGGGGGGGAWRVRAAFSPGGTCYDCHTVVKPADPGSLDFRIAPVRLSSRYLPSGAFDHRLAAHHVDARGRPTCTECHSAAQSERSSDLLLPTIARCADCHGAKAVKAGHPAGSDCAECHSYHSPGSATGSIAAGPSATTASRRPARAGRTT